MASFEYLAECSVCEFLWLEEDLAVEAVTQAGRLRSCANCRNKGPDRKHFFLDNRARWPGFDIQTE